MTLVPGVLAVLVSIIVTLVTCVQVLYLESLRIRTRERESLQYFKETLEARLGMETERGSLTFSLIKHVGLAVIGCLTLAATAVSDTPFWQAILVACLLVSFYTVVGTF